MAYTCKVNIHGPHTQNLCIKGTHNCTVHPKRKTKGK